MREKIAAFSMLFLVLVLSYPVAGQVHITPLDIKVRVLSNGMKVVSVQDNTSPTVAVHVWYNVGSKNDPQERSGFAHMFEHLMFKSTKNMKAEMLDRLTEDVGGFNNATTYSDFTDYYEVIPSNYFETLLWAEAERMVNINVNEQSFASERDVVKEEFRQSILANPYGMLYGQYVEKLSYASHPYKRPGIGNLDELNAATPQDANQFYKTYYRPDNAYLVVVGNFNQDQFEAWTDKYFGTIAKPTGIMPRVTITEPDRTKEMRHSTTAPNVPFPAVAITYLAPPSKSDDIPAFKIAESILSGGESSRLYQSLVYKQQVAQDASFWSDIRMDKGLLIFYATASEGKTPEVLEKAMLGELLKIQKAAISDAELEKVKNQLITRALQERETNDGKALAIVRSMVYMSDPNSINTDIQKIQQVTAADVQRVMQKYFTDSNRVVIYYQQKAEK